MSHDHEGRRDGHVSLCCVLAPTRSKQSEAQIGGKEGEKNLRALLEAIAPPIRGGEGPIGSLGMATSAAEEEAVPVAEARAQAEKRAAAEDGEGAEAEEEGNEMPEPKRRRACVAALEGVRRAAADAAEENGDGGGGGAGGPAADGGSSFSFHARSFSGVETTPKFGSFNPADDLLVAFQLKPPPPPMDAPAKEEPPAAAAGDDDDEEEHEATAEEGNDGISQQLGVVDQ